MTTSLHLDDARVICDCQRRPHATAPTLPRLAAEARRVLPLCLSLCLAMSSLGFAPRSSSIDPALEQIAPSLAAELDLAGPAADATSPDSVVTQAELDAARRAYFHRHVPYGAMIYREAVRNGLEPELVAAIIRAESNFRAVAVSAKSATGLMQLVPATGMEHGVIDLTDPRSNLEAGTRHLRRLQALYGGNLSLTLAAYNAGEGAVRRYSGVPPYRETQYYVQRVTSYRREFRQAVARLAIDGVEPRENTAQR